jgi:hypothetical protein
VQQRDLNAKEKHLHKLANAEAALDRFYAEYNDKKQRQVAKNKELPKEQPNGSFWVIAAKLGASIFPCGKRQGQG